MTITNNGTTPDRLTCVSSDASAQCQIHTMTMEGGVMKMRPVEGGLEIKPGETVTLKPSGLHVMFSTSSTRCNRARRSRRRSSSRKPGTVDVELPDRRDRRARARRCPAWRHEMMEAATVA